MIDETYYYKDLYDKVNKDLTYFKPVKHVDKYKETLNRDEDSLSVNSISKTKKRGKISRSSSL